MSDLSFVYEKGLFVKCGGYSYKEFLARAMKIARAILFA